MARMREMTALAAANKEQPTNEVDGAQKGARAKKQKTLGGREFDSKHHH